MHPGLDSVVRFTECVTGLSSSLGIEFLPKKQRVVNVG